MYAPHPYQKEWDKLDPPGEGVSTTWTDTSGTRYGEFDTRPIISHVAQAMLAKYGGLIGAGVERCGWSGLDLCRPVIFVFVNVFVVALHFSPCSPCFSPRRPKVSTGKMYKKNGPKTMF
jgi:hypothetical protein